ncbi:hypothetical protein BVRB_9g218220 [Beta vulgaris subsp. vulgaris]|nr:hypothetical protein BVRB_9g218220 [Beta vulgaris subsp. vulgaris]
MAEKSNLEICEEFQSVPNSEIPESPSNESLNDEELFVPDSESPETPSNESFNIEEDEELIVPDTPDREVVRSEVELEEFPLPSPEEIYNNLKIYFPAVKLKHCQPSRELP